QVWTALAEAGVTSLAVAEVTGERLERQGRASLLAGPDLAAAARRSGRAHPLVQRVAAAGGGDPSHAYLLTEDASVYRQVLETACERVGGGCRGWFEDGLGIVELPMHADAAATLGLGIWAEDLATARDHGF